MSAQNSLFDPTFPTQAGLVKSAMYREFCSHPRKIIPVSFAVTSERRTSWRDRELGVEVLKAGERHFEKPQLVIQYPIGPIFVHPRFAEPMVRNSKIAVAKLRKRFEPATLDYPASCFMEILICS
jgi:hypothetical protein